MMAELMPYYFIDGVLSADSSDHGFISKLRMDTDREKQGERLYDRHLHFNLCSRYLPDSDQCSYL